LAAVTSRRQHCQFLFAVARFDWCSLLLPALTAVTSCRQHWQLLQAVASIVSFYLLLPGLTGVLCCCQSWQQLVTAVKAGTNKEHQSNLATANKN
jgi:hypothetical protein